MSDRFRLGIIGCGRIANRHIKAGLASSSAEMTAMIDPVRERAQALCDEYQISAKITSDISEVLDHVDGFIIATPNHLHRPLAVQCLQARKAVLIEKPLATTVEDGEAICRAAAETDTTAMVGYVTRFRTHVSLFKQLYDSRQLGTARRFAYQYGTRGGWTSYSSFNLDRDAMGGGVMVGTGSHFLDRMLYWFGYPDRIAFRDDSHGGPEASCCAEFEFEQNGYSLRGNVGISRTVSRAAGFVMETDLGHVVLKDEVNADIRFQPYSTPGIEHILRPSTSRGAGEPDSFLLQLDEFIAASREQREPLVTVKQGLLSIKLIEEMYAKRTSIPENWYPKITTESAT